jgi:2-C-methyl-D-erythritol 4-phosphate cytidylyltransferase
VDELGCHYIAVYSKTVSGGERKDHNRYHRFSGRHEIPSVHDAVRCLLEAKTFAEAIAAFYPDRQDCATLAILETYRAQQRW